MNPYDTDLDRNQSEPPAAEPAHLSGAGGEGVSGPPRDHPRRVNDQLRRILAPAR